MNEGPFNEWRAKEKHHTGKCPAQKEVQILQIPCKHKHLSCT